jgi:thiamine kinase-like enzyme
MTNTPQIALARIPGWEDAHWSELSGGQTNRTWLVRTGDRKAVLKVDAAPRVAPYNERSAERRIQEIATAAGLANAVLYADERTYLTEFVEGKVWVAADFGVEENLEILARLLRCLHSQPLSGRHFDAVDAAEAYIANIDVANSTTAQRCVEIVRALHAPHNLCCCHNDLVAGNIIATPELRLLDWEYACDNDPLFDLAIVVAHHGLSEEIAHLFLDQYFDGDGERWREKLGQQMMLYNALVWLWYASRPDPDPKQLLVFESRLP